MRRGRRHLPPSCHPPLRPALTSSATTPPPLLSCLSWFLTTNLRHPTQSVGFPDRRIRASLTFFLGEFSSGKCLLVSDKKSVPKIPAIVSIEFALIDVNPSGGYKHGAKSAAFGIFWKLKCRVNLSAVLQPSAFYPATPLPRPPLGLLATFPSPCGSVFTSLEVRYCLAFTKRSRVPLETTPKCRGGEKAPEIICLLSIIACS